MIIIKYKDTVFKKLNLRAFDVEWSDALDAYGSFSFSFPLADPDSDLLTQRKEVQIWEDGVYKYGGYITSVEDDIAENIPIKRIDGVGYVEDFLKKVTLPNKLFQNELITDILNPAYGNTLIRAPFVWQTIVQATTKDITYLSSMQPSLATFDIVRRQVGYHFRYIGDSSDPRKIEFGELGDESGIRIRQYVIKKDEELPDNYLLVDDGGLTKIENSLNIANKIFVIGGGGDNGVNQLTLRDAEASKTEAGYPILVDPEVPNTDATYDPIVYQNARTGPNTFSAFYIKDQDSIDTYGLVEKAISFQDVYPLPSSGNQYTDQDRKNGANELYKAGLQYLKENKDPQVTYRLNAVGNASALKSGSLVSLKYQGIIQKVSLDGNVKRIYADIDDSFFIVGYSVSYEANGYNTYVLEISNKPSKIKDDSDVIKDLVSKVYSSDRQRQGSVTTFSTHYQDSFDNSFRFKSFLWIPEDTVFTDYIRIKIRIREFRSYSKAVGGGGAIAQSSSSNGAHSHGVTIPNHDHVMFSVPAASFPIPPGGLTTGLRFDFPTGGSLYAYGSVSLSGTTKTVSSGGGTFQTTTFEGFHSHTVTLPDHTHSMLFGIFEDTTPPTGVRIFIDGVDFTTQLGGPWSSFTYVPSTLNLSADLLKAASNLGVQNTLLTPGLHTIEASCTAGRAMIEMWIYNQFYISSR